MNPPANHGAQASLARGLLVEHELRLAASAVRRLAARPADLLTALAALGLLVIVLPAGWQMAQEAQPPRAVTAVVLLLWPLLAFVARRVELRLAWFAEETPFAAAALSKGPSGFYRLLWTGSAILLLALPIALLVATMMEDARVLGLALLAGAAGVTHGRWRRKAGLGAARGGGRRPVPPADGAALLAALLRARQLSLPPRLVAGRRGLGIAAAIGAAAGGAACLALVSALPMPLRLLGGVAALAAMALLTRVNMAVALAAASHGYSAGRLACAYLSVPAAALAGYLIVTVLAAPALPWAVAIAGSLATAILAWQGLLRALRSSSNGLAKLTVEIEVGAILLIGFYLPPAALAVAAWRVASAARAYRARMWRADL